ncbi:Glycine cleavage system transcriptional activator [Roseovarius litorisediminis]|uniref:Glycine cleavage system transcriptional activator n=1 Tax=Roseovarius litorisediminis TaxID=1312363 RepID=A0A1Y5RML7_9RHOB|nr:LysR substrate-binding domain-containing protein [Roseovarius litorisediminis]SLN20662.1 Glycine cleavage system transcriptional activator [Roseovarius litorisediminis]
MLKNRAVLPRLDYLLSFEVAAELESFSAAANELNVSETAVSRKIRLLELHYQCALFVRGHRSVRLTDMGRKLLNGVSPALESLARVSEDMCNDLEKSSVRLAATNSVASLWIMPRLAKFHAANCNITISLVSSDRDAECLSDDFELIILRGDGQWPGFEARELFGETVFPVCAPGYLENHLTFGGPEDFLNHSLIEVSNNHTEWLNWKTWLAHKGANPEKVRHSTFVNTYPLAIQAAVDGLGVALGWGHLVDRHLQAGTLVRPLGAEHVRTKSGYYLLRRQGAKAHAESDVVANWLLQESAGRTRYRQSV